MNERPIIFSGEMIKAILEGRKTQTRRIIKPQPRLVAPDSITIPNYCSGEWACPHGHSGEKLWVRESWRVGAWQEDEGKIAVDYKADGYCRRKWLTVENQELFMRLWQQSTDDAQKVFGRLERYKWQPGESPCRWRSARFMPRWASRITLKIINIRPERLQRITSKDALAEGIKNIDPQSKTYDKPYYQDYRREDACTSNPVKSFITLWDSINDKTHPWKDNPWVWVIEFKRIK